MKTTIDLPEEELDEVSRQACAERDVIVTGISEPYRRQRLEKVAQQLGTFDHVMSRAELLQLRE